jgi:hypothetical protein
MNGQPPVQGVQVSRGIDKEYMKSRVTNEKPGPAHSPLAVRPGAMVKSPP